MDPTHHSALAAGAALFPSLPAAVAGLAAAAVFGLLSAFLVAAEIAVTRVAAGGTGAAGGKEGPSRLQAVAADPTRFLNLVLMLRVAFEVAAVVAAAAGFAGLLGAGWPALLLTLVVMAPVDYVLMGVTPRILGRQFSVPIAGTAAALLAPVAVVLGPVAQGLVRLGRGLTPRNKGERSGPFSSEEELRRLVDLAERGHVIDAEEREMIHSVFKLDDTVVREVMVPRTDIVFIGGDESLDDCLSLALRSGFSRIPVTGEDEDDVIGIVYLKDAASLMQERWARGGGERGAMPAARDVMRPASYVPDSKPIDELLRDMQRQRIHVSVVIDEYGGTAGLVTIEDIVEEIVGEITDEYDDEIPPIERLGEDRARVTARLPLGELAELFGTEVDAPEVDTVGGLLAYALGRVPITGSKADYAGLRLTAENPAGRRNRTATILVERIGEAGGAGPDAPRD
ncbi:CBS domain containing-hemolysin-like protein [Nocardiopsis composta]|uniref:CBS domain containing-hemolysin-like protein n=1 Tax=Nocardiopsis composta TaxID=157465 RepID=A0A7W8VDK8_9ACTN|nr:CBS domain containing-hemolysin-like protein [Nocardiopsis composta]